MKKTFTAALLLALLLVTLCIPFAGAQQTENSVTNFITELDNPSGRILGIAFRGDTQNYPENSLQGIASAAETGIDAVLVDVQSTKDGTLILFADETTKRCLAGKEVFTVAETDYKTLTKYYLKNGTGGERKATRIKIPTLSDALDLIKENNTSLVVKCSASLLQEVNSLVKEKGMSGSVALMLTGKSKDVFATMNDCKDTPPVITEIRSNVIFSVTGFENKTEAAGGKAVCLKTTNRYGVNYYKSALALINERLRAVADLSDPETAGHRSDTEKWWDDLISRGYSVIITTEPGLFSEYLTRTDYKRRLLQEVLNETLDCTLPVYKTEIFNDYKKAYDDAVNTAMRLLDDNSSACRDLSDAIAMLRSATDGIMLNYEELEKGSAGTNVTPTSIGLCIFAVVLVLSAEIFTWKKRKK